MNQPGASQISHSVGHDGLTLRPAPDTWTAAAIEHHQRVARDPEALAASRSLRRELGLPEDGIIIMSGHQAEWWHPGILAKWLAMEAVAAGVRARGMTAHAVWVVVDQDANEAWKIRLPWRASGELGIRWLTLPITGHAPRGEAPAPDTPTGMRAALRAVDVRTAIHTLGHSGFKAVDSGLALMSELLAAHAHASSLAEQFGNAVLDAVGVAVGKAAPGLEAPRPVMASRLGATGMFASMLSSLQRDAAIATRSYNEAVTAAPDAKLRPLTDRAGRIETPLWRLRPGTPRGRVDAAQLGNVPTSELAPRALLMTALLRLGACNLFIHGLGGERYERVNDRWIDAWLQAAIGGASTPPAPVSIATATRFIPELAEGSPPPTAEQITKLQWTAHHARHAPGILGDAGQEAERERLVQRIRTARREGRSPREAFLELHRFLESFRGTNSAGLQHLAEQAGAAARRSAESNVVYARDWAFPLYPRDLLRHLQDQIQEKLTPANAQAAVP